MIRFDQVSKRYRNEFALRDLSFEIDKGELVFLTGHSGAGKSTVLKLIARLEHPNAGVVSVAGVNLARVHRKAVERLRREIGLVFQDHRLIMDRKIRENVALPLLIRGLRRKEVDARVRAALERVALWHRHQAFPVELSAGEKQRVGIARAIAARPRLLLADEPTGNLDPELSLEVMNLFIELQASGQTAVIASHDLSLIRSMRRRVLVLDRGQLVDDFRPTLA